MKELPVMANSSFKDHLGRPIVAVTGMGVITSLGQGLADNWAALTSGTSGIHAITRFPTEGLSTRISGTVDFIDPPRSNSVERSFAFARETTIEALAQAGISGDFDGPLFLAAPPVEPEWSDRFALADRAPPAVREGDAYDRFLAAMRERPDPVFMEAAQFGSISERLADKFGTRGLPVTLSTACASGATAIQLGVEAIRQGNPLDPQTMIGAQASSEQLEKILSYLDIGRQEGAQVLTGGARNDLGGELASGYYVKPTIFAGHNKMRVFQEEIFGPVVSVATFKDDAQALEIANDTLYGLGAGVWTRDGNRAYRFGRDIQAGRVWTNCYHAYPAHAAFGGYKQSGIGRETHKMMLDHYQQTKNMLVSYSPKALGFF